MIFDHPDALNGLMEITNERVSELNAYLMWHGVLGEACRPEGLSVIEEFGKLKLACAIYCLIPRTAVSGVTPDQARFIKPLIRNHLNDLNLRCEELLVETLKRVCDQLRATDPGRVGNRQKKMRISDLRAQNRLKYKDLRDAQNGRCKICGVVLDQVLEELDHIVPWRIIGDVHDGANWQILCSRCNQSKSHLVSIYLHPEAWNWVYSGVVNHATGVSPMTRYAVLCDRKECFVCRKHSSSTELFVVNRTKCGLHIFSHLDAICEQCALEKTLKVVA